MNVLADPIFSVETGGDVRQWSLPDVFAALVGDEIESFPQLAGVHHIAWHQFLVQLGAIATDGELPSESSVWKELLLQQAPKHTWELEHDNFDEPAFLQPDAAAATDEEVEYNLVGDELPGSNSLVNYDLTVGSKGHSLKRGQASGLTPEQEIYAVLFLQTNGRYGGPGHDSPTRSNGSRPFFTVTDTFRPGPWITREIKHLRSQKRALEEIYGFESRVHPLLWTISWAKSPLPFSDLHPLYIDCARQMRRIDGAWHSVSYFKNEARVEDTGKDATGDYWAPIDGSDTLKPKDRTFGYRELHQILFGSGPDLPASFDQEIENGWIVARGPVSGTKGSQSSNFTAFHRRHIRFSDSLYNAEPVAEESKRRYGRAEDGENILRAMIAAASLDTEYDWKGRYHRSVDQFFFDELFTLADEDEDTRRQWDPNVVNVLNELASELRARIQHEADSAAEYWKRAANLESVRERAIRSQFNYLYTSTDE
jgi:hypothetical protein